MLLLFGLFLAAPLHAARFIPVEDQCNGRHLLIQGAVEPGDYERFLDFMARHVGGEQPAVQDPDVLWTVELDSPGGDVPAAMRIGRFLRDAFATTEVGYRYAERPDGVWDFARGNEVVCLDGQDRLAGCEPDLVEGQCTGACLLIWLAGSRRHADVGALGDHGLSAHPKRELEAYLAAMDVAPDWSRRILDAGVSESGWLSWPQRHELSRPAPALAKLIAACPPPLTRDESYQSVVAASAARRDALMDRADAHRSCRRARLAEARGAIVAALTRRGRGDTVAAAGGGEHR